MNEEQDCVESEDADGAEHEDEDEYHMMENNALENEDEEPVVNQGPRANETS